MADRRASEPVAERRAHLLVADDNKINRMLLGRALQLEGYEVTSVEDGRQALERLRRERYDLLLLDMEMPEVDGFAVLETLHADPELRELPVIVTSALEGIEHVARCIRLGADDFLAKPVNPVLLQARVGSSLEKKWLRERNAELLQREIAHQVAERSRELGEAIVRASLMPTSPPAAGVFEARYEVVRPLGEGGMGAVFEVARKTDGARLAMKVMTGHVSREAAARFAREAEIGARMRDPHLVSIVDVGVTDAGAPFLVMELVTGGSLEGQRARFGSVAWALPLLRRVARALATLHAAGIVHRDLKPANVLLDAHGAAKVSDFGIARFSPIALAVDPLAPTSAGAAGGGPIATAGGALAGALTGTGAWLGTPLYMAPEAAQRGREVTPAADVFAFGLLAHELLSGGLPFPVAPMLLSLAGQTIPEPTTLEGAGLEPASRQTLRACLRGEPAERPTIDEVIAALG
jgi:CheY-like chemotaxis protein